MTADTQAEREPVDFYTVRSVLDDLRYRVNERVNDDPGLHPCSCGDWKGYWVDFHGHVAHKLLQLLNP